MRTMYITPLKTALALMLTLNLLSAGTYAWFPRSMPLDRVAAAAVSPQKSRPGPAADAAPAKP